MKQDDEQHAVDEHPKLKATVELETQAKIDSDVRDRIAAAEAQERPNGMTLEAQEKWEAREAEKRRTRERADRRQTNRRDVMYREMTKAKYCGLSSRADPRKKLDVETRREVNKHAH